MEVRKLYISRSSDRNAPWSGVVAFRLHKRDTEEVLWEGEGPMDLCEESGPYSSVSIPVYKEPLWAKDAGDRFGVQSRGSVGPF